MAKQMGIAQINKYLSRTIAPYDREEVKYCTKGAMSKVDMDIPSEKGIYVLVIFVREFLEMSIGSLGIVRLTPGYYIYIGSAMNLGGLRSRITRHLNRNKKKKYWHIDYLTVSQHVNVVGIIYSIITNATGIDYESILTSHILRDECFAIAHRRFGAMDKKWDASHLYKCICHFSKCINNITYLFYLIKLDPKTVLQFQ